MLRKKNLIFNKTLNKNYRKWFYKSMHCWVRFASGFGKKKIFFSWLVLSFMIAIILYKKYFIKIWHSFPCQILMIGRNTFKIFIVLNAFIKKTISNRRISINIYSKKSIPYLVQNWFFKIFLIFLCTDMYYKIILYSDDTPS